MCLNLGTLKIETYGMVFDRRMVSDPRHGMLCRVSELLSESPVSVGCNQRFNFWCARNSSTRFNRVISGRVHDNFNSKYHVRTVYDVRGKQTHRSA